MSVIKLVLDEEYIRLMELADNYKKKLENLPKGSLSRKVRSNNIYLYRAFRDSDKIRFIYIGKEDSDQAREAIALHAERVRYRDLLKKVKSEIKEVRRALNGYN